MIFGNFLYDFCRNFTFLNFALNCIFSRVVNISAFPASNRIEYLMIFSYICNSLKYLRAILSLVSDRAGYWFITPKF